MPRVTGLWVYQKLGPRPDPDAVAARAQRHGLEWLTAQAIECDELLDTTWLREMRRATKERGMRLGVHGYIGRQGPKPVAEAKALAAAIDLVDADFAIVNAEKEYEASPNPDPLRFVEAYRALKPRFVTYFSSFGRPELHPGLDWAVWANAGFRGMPQAYANLNPDKLQPAQCVADYARFFKRQDIRVTLGCFSEHGKPHLPVADLVAGVNAVGGLHFNVYRHGTVKTAELAALAALG